MYGTLLHFVSVAILAGTAFGTLAAPTRLAAAALTALGGPVLVIVVAARLGQEPSTPLVVVAHLLTIAVACICTRRPSGETRRELSRVFLVAGAVALLSALLGRDPSGVVLVDAWAHLAWSRHLVTSLDAYAPGFPALLATLTPHDVLVGAFRGSALVLHFALATQMLALAPRSLAPGALAALAYLVVPVAGTRFEPPVPELSSAVFLAGAWWILALDVASIRRRAIALAAAITFALTFHVSALQIAMLAGLAGAIVIGAGGGGWAERATLLVAVASGVTVAAALSPSFLALVFDSGSVALVSMQPGGVHAVGLREVVASWGLGLCGLLAVVVFLLLRPRSLPRGRERASLLGMLVAAILLSAPLVLEPLGVRVPLQLFTSRLLMAAALPLSLFVALGADRARPVHPRWDVGAGAGITVLVIAQLLRPSTSIAFVGLAALVAIATIVILRDRFARGLPVAVVAVLVGALAVRLWVWTPRPTAAAQWLANVEPHSTVFTNWPVTNELDALVDQTVLDGLAGRDANVALHRAGLDLSLRDRLFWCDDAVDLDALAEAADAVSGEVYVVVDERFERAWSAYRDLRRTIDPGSGPDSFTWLRESPCDVDDATRLHAVRATFRAWDRAEVVFEAPDVMILRMRSTISPERD